MTNQSNPSGTLDHVRMSALIYGLGIRLSQAKQIADFPSAREPDYLEDGRKRMDEDCFWLLKKWLARISSLTLEVEKILKSCGGEAVEVAAAATLSAAVDRLVVLEPPTRDVEVRGREEFSIATMQEFYKFNDTLHRSRELLDSAVEKVSILAAVLGRFRDQPLWPIWFDLGQEITRFFDERDDSALVAEEPWIGVFALDWDECRGTEIKLEVPSQVDGLMKKLGSDLTALLPALDPTDAVQQEIMTSGLLPDIFPAWFSVEAGYWPIVYSKSELATAPCLGRNLLLLKWYEEMRDNSNRINEVICDRWNSLPEAEKRGISPHCLEVLQTQTVKKVRQQREMWLDRGNRSSARIF